MDAVFTVIGYIIVTLLSVAILAGAIGYLLDKVNNLYYSMNAANREEARKELGLRIKLDSYWMSENEDSMNLMRTLGENIHTYGTYDISRVRDIVRDLRKSNVS